MNITQLDTTDVLRFRRGGQYDIPASHWRFSIASAVNVKQRLIPAVKRLHDAIAAKVEEWNDIVKIGRTHMQDATPLTLGQEWSGYAGMLADDLDRIEDALCLVRLTVKLTNG